MGSAKFTRKDSTVLTRGMLPEIPLNATEMEIHEEICSVIRNSCELELSTCQPFNFEFMDMCGKNASVPNLKPGMTFNCKAGSGAVYVRMMKDFEGIGSSEDSDLPEISLSDAQPGTSNQQGTTAQTLASLDCSVVTDEMVQIFPQFSKEQLKFLLECCERDPDKIAYVLEDTLSSATWQRILRSFKIKRTVSESLRLRVECDDDEDEWVESAIAFTRHVGF